MKDELPKSAWLVSRMGRVTAGVQYEPQRKNHAEFTTSVIGFLNFFFFVVSVWCIC